MFLDFVEDPAQRNVHPRVVASPRLPQGGHIRLDGSAQEWDASLLTRIRGRVMNNYPLDKHRDAVPGDILIGSAFDNEFVYFLLQFVDMNHDASSNRNRWIFKDGAWGLSRHTPANPQSPAARAVNRGERLTGHEHEDQVFMMFPIIDRQGNFQDGALGCAAYCHANLALGSDPRESPVGAGVAVMHTALPGDMADLWHWSATRSRPMHTLEDGYIGYGEKRDNGRKLDAGSGPFEENVETEPFRPRYVHKGDLENGNYQKPAFATHSLLKQDLAPITPEMEFAEGVSLPFYIGVAATGSQADVQTAAGFDRETFTWTLEFKRKRDTGDAQDHPFIAGPDAAPPVSVPVAQGDPERGLTLYLEKACANCHGGAGEGSFKDGKWDFPRNQRVSAPLIRKTASPMRPERLRSLVFHLKQENKEPPESLMPFVPLTPQEAEDIAAWLQQQYIPAGH